MDSKIKLLCKLAKIIGDFCLLEPFCIAYFN